MHNRSILFIVQNNSFPFDKRVKNEAMSLREHGYNIIVICPSSRFDLAHHEISNGIEIFRYSAPLSDGSKIGFIKEYLISLYKIYLLALRTLFTRKYHAIHVANPPDFFWPLAVICHLFKVKFIYDQHDLAPEMFRIKFSKGLLYSFMRWNEKMSVKLADRIIVVNETFQRLSIETWKANKNKYAVVYNGPSDKFRGMPNKEIIDRYKGKKIVLYIGLMTVNDNIEVILEIASRIFKDPNRQNCHFILVGGGEVEEVMKQQAVQMGLKDKVEFTGIVNHERVMEYLEVADVCIAPDSPNGLNEHLTLIKTLEYMKAGKPFVSFRLPQTMAIGGSGGLYAEDIYKFVANVLSLLDNPQEAIKVGEAGKQIIENKYLWRYSEKILWDLYDSLWK